MYHFSSFDHGPEKERLDPKKHHGWFGKGLSGFQGLRITPPKFNIAPEKWWLEDYFRGKVTFRGLCLTSGG